jgi:hypothetical protein
MPRLLALVLACAAQASSASAADWQQFLDKDGVKGYSRSVPGSKILELRSTMVVPARIEVVGAVLRDVESLARSDTGCVEARFLEKQDRDHYTFYTAYDLPWPLSDRDAAIEVAVRYDLDRGRVIATLRAVDHPRAPRRKRFVRITDLTAKFVVEYISRDRTGVVFTSRTDPAGRIPAFLINYGNKRNLRTSALDLRRATQASRYRAAAVASPDAALAARVTGDARQMTKIVSYRLGELITDRHLVGTLLADRGLHAALVKGTSGYGEIVLHGWGSRASKHRAVAALLRPLLASRSRDYAAIDRFLADPARLDRLLGPTGNAEVTAFIARLKASP